MTPENAPRRLFVVLFGVFLAAAACSAGVDMAETSLASTSSSSASLSQPSTTGPAELQPTATSEASAGELPSTLGERAEPTSGPDPAPKVVTGAGVLVKRGFDLLEHQRVGLVVNAASVVGDRHLVDLVAETPTVDLVTIFTPEHGLRGDEDAGASIQDAIDPTTGVPVRSLYDDTRAPTAEELDGIDVIVYDLQDAGARCYTYITTLGLVMEAAAAAGVAVMVLDRPDPRGGTVIDGPVLEAELASFVGPYPIPLAYAMTSGELARAIVGEGWVEGADSLELTVVDMEGWSRGISWSETGQRWVPPSPGLPTAETVLGYPGTVLFEATSLSFGQGTEAPFMTIGGPGVDGEAVAAVFNGKGLVGVTAEAITFVPSTDLLARPGLTARFEGDQLGGVRLRVLDPDRFRPVAAGLHLLDALGGGDVIDRPEMFELLVGSRDIRAGLLAGTPVEDIVAGWSDSLDAFDGLRRKYLVY